MDARLAGYLRAIAWRMRAAAVGRRVMAGGWLVAGGLLVLGAVRMAGGAPPFSGEILALAGGIWVLVGLGAVVGSGVGLVAAAGRGDTVAGGAERLVTAARLGRDGWGELVLEDALALGSRWPAATVVRWRWGRWVGWAMIPVVVALGMALGYRERAGTSAAERMAAAEVLDEAAAVVSEGGEESLTQTGRELEERAEALRERLADAPREDALRALVAAAADVERLRGERAAGRDGGDAGRSADAGATRDSAPPAATDLASSEASATGDTRQLSEAELAAMASRLEEMKRAVRSGEQRPGAGEGERGEGGGELAKLAGEMGSGEESAEAGKMASDEPGGGPGENAGGGGELFGERTDVAVSGLDDQAGLDGGEGAAVTVGTVSVDGPGRANAAYREAYDAAARAAEDAVTREDLPYGSRELVRRYFERIKPEE